MNAVDTWKIDPGNSEKKWTTMCQVNLHSSFFNKYIVMYLPIGNFFFNQENHKFLLVLLRKLVFTASKKLNPFITLTYWQNFIFFTKPVQIFKWRHYSFIGELFFQEIQKKKKN